LAEVTHRRTFFAVIAALLVAVAAFAAGHLTAGRGEMTPSAVDVGFSQDMAVHHEQAILMSTLAQTRGDATVRTIASGILTGQSQEVGAMRGWLRLWHQPAVDAHPMSWMSTMHGHGMAGMSNATMPGMAEPTQLTRLAQLHGASFDRLFLQLMIRHHRGGVSMAADARRHAGLKVVLEAAATMIVEQVEEIGAMQALLAAHTEE